MKPDKTITAGLLAAAVGQVQGWPRLASSSLPRSRGLLDKRQDVKDCGAGWGSCDHGLCCSEAGYCGSGEDFCDGASCQLEYCDSCDTYIGPPGSTTEHIPRPHLGNVPYGTLIDTCTTPGMLALTFDDGPYMYTSQILDILDELKVKATFFVSGNNLGKGHMDDAATPWPAILRRMHDTGHHIGSHTWTHRDLNQVNSSIQSTEMIYNEMAFRNLFGWFPAYMRPPYLECSAESGCTGLMATLGYHIININLDTKDYMYDAPELIQVAKDRFSQGVAADSQHNAYINLAHDIHYQTVVNLTRFMVETARDRGYRLVTVGQCLGDPQENWYRDAGGTSPNSKRNPASTELGGRLSDAAPEDAIQISSNEMCGGDTGYTCLGSRFGDCCSNHGYCGSGHEHCGTGCDNDFGTCDNDFGTCDNEAAGVIADTTNGLCGDKIGATCANYGNETCCSAYGFCGGSEHHCGQGCQTGYGECD